MAVAPTGAIYKALKFDNVSSRTYGVYITGEAVYNAPERDVEMITIPGRSGSFALDNGRFENIEVSYPAGIFADTEADFRQAISDFRNFLCSRNGYVRLQDEYNPDEYRMAVYKSGLEVTPAMLKAGEFNIVFDCKPQRWLTSGETEVAVTSGDTLTNPTLFESSPMLEVEGYGNIQFNGYEIELENATIGDTVLKIGGSENAQSDSSGLYIFHQFEPISFNSGDYMSVSEVNIVANCKLVASGGGTITSATTTTPGLSVEYVPAQDGGLNLTLRYKMPVGSWETGLSQSFAVNQYFTIVSHYSDATETTHNILFYFSSRWSSYGKQSLTIGLQNSTYIIPASAVIGYSDIIVDSSLPALGHPTYIDCDLGEAYLINGGEPVSLNRFIDLGSDLPVLASGANEITFDNTITDLKVVPRWWKI